MVLTAQQLEAIMPDATQLESDEPEMESSQHYMQLMLLVSCLEWLWRNRNDYFIGANLTIYYSRQQLKTRDFRGPDFFLVKQTQKKPRKSWVVWEENGKYPNLIRGGTNKFKKLGMVVRDHQVWGDGSVWGEMGRS